MGMGSGRNQRSVSKRWRLLGTRVRRQWRGSNPVITQVRPATKVSAFDTKPATSTNLWLQAGLQLVVNIASLYIFQQITLHVWRAMTGH